MPSGSLSVRKRVNVCWSRVVLVLPKYLYFSFLFHRIIGIGHGYKQRMTIV